MKKAKKKSGQPTAAEPGRAMNPTEKRPRKRSKRIGRPPLGKGIRRVMISVEVELLKKSDHYALHHRISRSRMISDGLRLVMGVQNP
jgi:hypothetical protein